MIASRRKPDPPVVYSRSLAIRYENEMNVVAAFDDAILGPALNLRKKLLDLKKSEKVIEVDLEAMLSKIGGLPSDA